MISISTDSSIHIQEKIEQAFLQRNNIYISGVGGTGKSHFIRHLYHKYKSNSNEDNESNTYLCSTTGISSYNIGGRTLHSWAGFIYPNHIDDPKEILQQCLMIIKKDKYIMTRWKTTSCLFIDEISMLGGSYLTLLDTVARIVRKSSTVFGGIQIICTGDMLQLPPVKDIYPFQVDVWEQLKFKIFNLNTCFRFDDANYIELLKRARIGKLNQQDIELLQTRMNLDIGEIKPTIILSTKTEVDRINRTELDHLSDELLIFSCQDFVYNKKNKLLPESIPSHVLDSFNCDERLYIKIGAQVMLTINKCIKTGLANGSRGIVKSILKDPLLNETIIMVKFMNGTIEPITLHEFTVEENDKKFIRIGFPLKICFAITFHKVQGLTLDCVYVDIGSNIFCAGQAYVGLSRCKNLNSLYIRSFQPSKIFPNKTALLFEQQINNPS
jgi:ATP-dependent DNA helicase PIF1